MNILYISPINLKDPKRGTPIRIVNLLRQMRKQHELSVSCADVDAEFDGAFVQYPTLGTIGKLKYFLRFIRDRHIQIVMTSGEAGIKLPILLKLISNVKIANDIHGVPGEEELLAGMITKNKKRWIQFKVKLYMSFYDHLFPVSDKLKNFFSNVNNKATTIHGGVDLAAFPLRETSVGNEIFTIGYTGNFRSYQGLDLLFEAVKIIKNQNAFAFRLRLIVSGVKEEIEQRLSELDLTHDTDLFTNISHEQAAQLISGSDVLVIPRPSIPVTELAYPTKLPEFLATAVPVITTNVGPAKELFGNSDEYCLVVPSKNIVTELATAIHGIYSMSPEERRKLGHAGRDFVERHLTWEKIGEKLNNVLNNI
ncbi:MAG: glycosyltransferase family 4 protein [Patescibacteria group bacterium]|nr:glycosyltransferase family 4 protein [Patescibacteria group bacterium]